MKKILFILPLLLCGCFFTGVKSGSKSLTDSSAGEAAAQAVREGLATPPINIHAAEGAVVDVNVPQNDQTAKVDTHGKLKIETEEESSWFSKKKLPLTISIFIGAVSLILLLIAIKLWRAASASVNAGFTLADNTFAGGIHMLEGWLASSTDPSENAKLSALKAQFEKGRGKLQR